MRFLVVLAFLACSTAASAAAEFEMKLNEARELIWGTGSALIHFKSTISGFGVTDVCQFSVQFSGNGRWYPLDVQIGREPFELKDWLRIDCRGNKAMVTKR